LKERFMVYHGNKIPSFITSFLFTIQSNDTGEEDLEFIITSHDYIPNSTLANGWDCILATSNNVKSRNIEYDFFGFGIMRTWNVVKIRTYPTSIGTPSIICSHHCH
jgi:hypothetical protein